MIDWVDQNSTQAVCTLNNALTKAYGKTVGYFLKEDYHWLCIASECMRFDDGTETQYRGVVSFPIACITNIRKVTDAT